MDPRLFDDLRALEREHWWPVGRGRILLSLVERECRRRPVERLVDVGPGTGSLLEELRGLVPAAVGVESDPTARELARSRGLEILDGTAAELPFADGSVDLVTAFDVLEHVPDDEAAARELRRVLRPGGSAVVSVPAYRWLWSGHDIVHGHRRRYTKGSLVRALTAGGLTVRRSGYFNAWLLPLAAAARLGARILRRPARSDLTPVPPRLNALLLRIFLSERRRVAAGGFPAGLSVFAVADRPAS
ncbi:MAG: class I SAM-dependent methyltransferase [Actinobacteria bacterium]|nr:class I SAM-dependent methyltransferase [Actinomycetota bacterium]